MFIKLRNFNLTLQEVKKSVKKAQNISPSLENVLAEYLIIKLFADFEDDLKLILTKFRSKNLGLDLFLRKCIQEMSNTKHSKYSKELGPYLQSKNLISQTEQMAVENLINFRNGASCHVATISRAYKISDVEEMAQYIRSYLQKVARLNLLKI